MESFIRVLLDSYEGLMIPWVFLILCLEDDIFMFSEKTSFSGFCKYYFFVVINFQSFFYFMIQLAMSIEGRAIFKFSRWLGNLSLLLYVQVRQWLWFFFFALCGKSTSGLVLCGSNYWMETPIILFLIKIYQCLHYQLTRVKWTVIHRFNVNAGLRSFPPIEENKHRI